MQLRDYQQDLYGQIISAWHGGHQNVLAVAPTGAGKTAIKAHVFRESTAPGIAIAHRQELVAQISLALARMGVRHRILAPNPVVGFCIHQQVRECGQSFYSADAKIAVAGVRSLLSSRADRERAFLRHVRLWDIDEAHHVLPGNQWGEAIKTLPPSYGVGFTATPLRCDRKPLARSQGGTFDHMVVGPTERDLMSRGYLSRYKIYGPPRSFNRDEVRRSKSTGDFVKTELRTVAAKSTITGDVVEHYLRLAPGKRGLTFCVDRALASETAAAFRHRGVPAVMVDGNTADNVRQDALDQLARGDILQLVNVDLFGEGMDCPAIECVSMARPTQSLSLYRQQAGRLMRPAEGKDYGILIDHVGNVEAHGLPDATIRWTLEIEQRRAATPNDPDVMPIRTCSECLACFEAIYKRCPECGYEPQPEARSRPEHVDGDLIEYTPEMMSDMQGEIDRIDGPPLIPAHLDKKAAYALTNKWKARQAAQSDLRECLHLWANMWRFGHQAEDSEILRRFYHSFGIDVMSAQALGTKDATKLTEQIRRTMI